MHLTRHIATGTPMTDAVGKLPTGTDGNTKDKLDYGIDSRRMRVIEDKDEGTAKVHCLVTKNISPDLDDCSVSHRGLGRLAQAQHVGQDSRARGAADANRRQQHQASPSPHAHTARSLTDRRGLRLYGLPHCVHCGLGGTAQPNEFAGHRAQKRTQGKADCLH